MLLEPAGSQNAHFSLHLTAQVEYPERTLPRALALSVFSVILCTGLPLLVAAGNDRFWRCWEEARAARALDPSL